MLTKYHINIHLNYNEKTRQMKKYENSVDGKEEFELKKKTPGRQWA